MKFPDPWAWLRRFYRIPQTEDIKWIGSEAHRQRLEKIKTGWIIAGLVMLALDSNAAALGIFLFAGFLSLAFLDRDESTII